jgi:hypothetical protein
MRNRLNFIENLSGACRTGVLLSLAKSGFGPGRLSANHNRATRSWDNESGSWDRQQGLRAFPKLVAAQNTAARQRPQRLLERVLSRDPAVSLPVHAENYGP